ncbi:MAG: GH3 auxin-responsive promoter family protein [Verrucomicrobiales bacterium]
MNVLINLLSRLRLMKAAWFVWRPFLRMTRDPARVQRELLLTILARNRGTRFGREHAFASIRTPEEYAVRVPVQTYEDLRPYIERQEEQRTPELVPEQPLMYARTSGSTGAPKLIPVLKDTIARHHLSQQIFSCCHAAEVPGLFDGSILGFVSPAVEGHLPTGTPFGSMSGLIYQSMPRLLRRKYLVPPEVFACADHDLKYRLIAIFAAADRHISYIAGANPSSFLKMARVIQAEAPAIIAAVESGELPGLAKLDAESARRIQTAFRGSRQRAAELRKLFDDNQEVTFARLWPDLKAVSCWREGSCRVLLPALQRLLPEGLPMLEMGYLSSEFRGSVPVSSLGHLEVPTFHENYFEFIERDDWESGRATVRTMAEIESGKTYHVIVTTQAGLFRYFMNDLVVVDGFYERVPTIKFLEKGAGVTNITGEKLYESQVTAAMESVARTRNWFPDFFMLVADADRQCYRLYAEAHDGIGADLDRELDAALAARNIEYESKRESGRLNPVELKLLRPGTGEAYKAHLVANGQREAQFKFQRLQSREKLGFNFDEHLISLS